MADVHRLRFLDIKPSSILCIAFNSTKRSPRIAVSRSDGSIEIWNVINESMITHHVTIPGRTDVSVEKLVWYKRRLISAGLSGTINEWDTCHLRCVTSVDAMGSPIWCVGVDHAHKRLAAGTDNGKICLYDLSGSSIQYLKTMDNLNCRVLSLSWHVSGASMVAGCSDGRVHVIDTDTGRCTLRITLDDKMAANTPSDTLVWDVLYLSDYTIVTGSSCGKVQFWNSQFGTLRHSYQSHMGDVSSLVVNSNEGVVYGGGVDSKVVQFKRVSNTWIQCKGVRAHTHDIRSLAITDNGCVISGGVDTLLYLYPVIFNHAHTIKYSPFLSWSNRFKYNTVSNVLMYQGNTSLKFWRITPKHTQLVNNGNSSSCSPDKDGLGSDHKGYTPLSSLESDLLLASGLPVHFLEIKIPSVDHILSSNISEDGSIVVMSCIDNTWIYRIDSDHVKCLGNDLSSLDDTLAMTMPTAPKARHRKRFKDALFITPLEHNELLVVEKPWKDVVQGLPPGLKRKKYGNS